MKKSKLILSAFLFLLTSCGDGVEIPSNKRFYCDPPSDRGWALGIIRISYFEGKIVEKNRQFYFVDSNSVFHGTIGVNTHYSYEVPAFERFLNKNVVARFVGVYGLENQKQYKWLDLNNLVMEEVNAVYEATSVSEVIDLNSKTDSYLNGMTSQWYLKEVKRKKEGK